MKQIATIILVMILTVTCAAPCCAEETADPSEVASSLHEYAKSNVLWLADVYNANPDGFDADYVFLLHGYAQICMAALEIENAEIHVKCKTAGEAVMNESMRKDSTKSVYSLYEMTEGHYMSWLAGEISNREYCEKVLVILKALST